AERDREALPARVGGRMLDVGRQMLTAALVGLGRLGEAVDLELEALGGVRDDDVAIGAEGDLLLEGELARSDRQIKGPGQLDAAGRQRALEAEALVVGDDALVRHEVL